MQRRSMRQLRSGPLIEPFTLNALTAAQGVVGTTLPQGSLQLGTFLFRDQGGRHEMGGNLTPASAISRFRGRPPTRILDS
jgi:hypothetical protein